MTVSDIIGKWPSASQFARDLGLKNDSHGTVMLVRKSIPVTHWPKVLDSAKSRGIELTYEDLVNAHAQRVAVA